MATKKTRAKHPKTHAVLKFREVTYDVWGNARDGFEVNDKFRGSAIVSLTPEATDGDIMAALRAAGIIPRGSRATSYSIEWDGGDNPVYISRRKDGKPLGELEPM